LPVDEHAPRRLRECFHETGRVADALRRQLRDLDVGVTAAAGERDQSDEDRGAAHVGSIRRRTYDPRMPPFSVADPLAHRALEALMRAEAHVRRSVAAELARAGLSTGAFSVLVVLTTAGGELELRTLRRRLGWSKANSTEVTAALERQGLVVRRRLVNDRRAMVVGISADGAELVQRVFPTHADRVSAAFAALDEDEKRSLASICRKLAA
jgi:MarR family 2-MHQ and catechol resistance regulon transcriptional repressor